MGLHYTCHEFYIELLNFLLEKQDFTNRGNESVKTMETLAILWSLRVDYLIS